MKSMLTVLRERNELLFQFGLICLVLALACVALIWFMRTQVLGVNAWYKPLKFFLSTAVFVWSMAWYTGYLTERSTVAWYSWGMVALFGIELVYIVVQAARGQQSHFNVGTPVTASFWVIMAVSAVGISIWTARVGLLFFRHDFPELPAAYVWGIRLGLVLFVLFSMQGLAMGGRMAHTVGSADGGPGLPVVNWSTQYGDLRIAHFLGMHALQVVPLLAYYLLKDIWQVVLVSVLYGTVTLVIFIQALQGKPLLRFGSRLADTAIGTAASQ
ncbi:hypothetical protein FAES_0544 [Fibrella aestuarina BUZ 2]|uniref:Uncharacterized protein n=1 Tax=Fibrella aestuarina BUZ 2 TaxID=1166018 RepID=I0K352_9BACT|nr:hypothetical protein [Fibrella aestuarina]CCG98555.1 hypothetical protein FAES_0544 [Fibrella aestuarina BUZ 2]